MDALEYEPPQAPQLDDFPAETSPVPWETLEDFPSPIIGCDYGYLRGRRLKCCPLEKLRKLCRRTGTGHPDLVWTPEHDHLVAPQEAWALQKAERRHLRTAALTWLLLGLLLGTMAYFLMDFAWDELKRPLDPWTPWGMREITREMQTRRFQLALLALFTTGVVPVIVGVRKLWRLGFHTARELARQATACRFRAWVKRRGAYVTWLIGLAIFAVFVAQLALISKTPNPFQAAGDIVESAGLVKSHVRNGELWRLLTGPMLHADFEHVLFNVALLLILGRLVEALTDRLYVPLVFLLSILAGSLASMVLLPETSSVGTSGGVLGLLGFVLVLGLHRRGIFPTRMLQGLLWGIVFLAISGAIAYKIIDNGAHLGGFLCGIALGFVFVKRGEPRWPLRAGRFVTIAGATSLLLILGLATLTIDRIW